MLKELFQFWTTPAMPLARKMGFLSEAIAMQARYQRCSTQWQAHFSECQNAIRQAVDQCDHYGTLVVLGAGSLKDIPLEFLSQRFDRVLLVDLVFLKAARREALQWPNVELVEADVSASLENAFHGQAESGRYQPCQQFGDVDCIVSLNLATQLPLIPVRWLMKRFHLPEPEAELFGRRMIEQHLADLADCDGVKCLIADRQITEYDPQGRQIDQFDPAWEVDLPEPILSWDWEVIPPQESYQRHRQINRVGASIWR